MVGIIVFFVIFLLGIGVFLMALNDRKQVLETANKIAAVEAKKKAKYEAEARERDAFSWPAIQVLDAFNALPEEHRPSYDIKGVLSSLDRHSAVKFGHGGWAQHWVRVWRSSYGSGHLMTPSWVCHCACYCTNQICECSVEGSRFTGNYRFDKKCKIAPEYYSMYAELEAISKALKKKEELEAERERTIALEGLKHEVLIVPEITAALRAEREVIEETNKEMIVK